MSTVFFSILIGAAALGQAAPNLSIFASAGAASTAVLRLIKNRSTINPFDTSGKKLDRLEGNIEFNNVHFAYPSRTEVPIFRVSSYSRDRCFFLTRFKGYNLSIKAGSTVALVGDSGSGKSTVIALLERFYDPDQGSIMVDGVDIKTLNVEWLRSSMGLVSQVSSVVTARVQRPSSSIFFSY